MARNQSVNSLIAISVPYRTPITETSIVAGQSCFLTFKLFVLQTAGLAIEGPGTPEWRLLQNCKQEMEMEAISIAEGSINWNGGQRITLRAGDTATCTSLRPGQLYGIFVYNSAQNDNTANVNVVWSNSSPPVPITVPGTTANAGLASMGFVSGSDTQTISASLPSNAGIAQVEIWLGSVSMPTDTSGLDNQKLPIDGKPHSFNKYRRYFAVPPSSWHTLTLVSKITQFVSCQFRQQEAVVFVLNQTSNGLLPGQVTTMGPTASAKGAVTINGVTYQSVSENLQGDGTQWVWMNADSEQDSTDASISLQAL